MQRGYNKTALELPHPSCTPPASSIKVSVNRLDTQTGKDKTNALNMKFETGIRQGGLLTLIDNYPQFLTLTHLLFFVAIYVSTNQALNLLNKPFLCKLQDKMRR